MPTIYHNADSALIVSGTRHVVQQMALEVLDPALDRAPTAVTVIVDGGWPGMAVEFTIDGTSVYTDVLDSTGAIGPLSLPVGSQYGDGVHTVAVAGTGAEASIGASGTFTLARDPHPNPRVVGPDTAPVDVPASHTATGVRRWVLQDLMPGGLGSWVLPRNPISCDAFPARRTLDQAHTTALNGRWSITEPGVEAHSFSFSGYLRTKDEHDKFVAYCSLKRRIYLIDHRGRAWVTVLTSPDLRPRKRIAEDGGVFNDWATDYTVQAIIYGDQWQVPQ
jgi:hypothetical protein